MAKCPNCGGKGKYKNGFGKIGVCYYCLGTGKVNDKGERNKTNDEWRRICSAEEFAEWISNLTYACMRCGVNCHIKYCPFDKCIIDKEDALEWLKEKHND